LKGSIPVKITGRYISGRQPDSTWKWNNLASLSMFQPVIIAPDRSHKCSLCIWTRWVHLI